MSNGILILQVMFFGEEGVDAGGVRKVKCIEQLACLVFASNCLCNLS